MSENIINNNALAALAQRAAPHVLSAIKQASAKTGVNFAYLVEQAAAESSFDEKAEAATSSAAGLYQFIESTWLRMVKQHGHKYGMGEMADAIDDRGRVADKDMKQAILDMRKDAGKAAMLAAEFAADNKGYLERHVDGDIGSTELYFAHFLGAGGAAGFLNAMNDNPLQAAADLFPKAARANRNVFYDRKTGEPRTLAAVYDFFAKKFKGSENFNMDVTPKVPARKPSSSHGVSQGTYARLQAVSMARDPFDGLSIMGSRAASTILGTGSKKSDGWDPVFKTSLVHNPVELMMIAQVSGQQDHEDRRRYNR